MSATAEILLQIRAAKGEREVRQVAAAMTDLKQETQKATAAGEQFEQEMREVSQEAQRADRSVGQTTGSLRRFGRASRGSSRLAGRLAGSLATAGNAASGFGGALGGLVPGLAEGAIVIGDATQAAEAFAGAGGAVLRILGPIGVAVAAGAVVWKVYANRLEEAEAAQRSAAEEAARAMEIYGGLDETLQGLNDQFRLVTGQVDEFDLRIEESERTINGQFEKGLGFIRQQLTGLRARKAELLAEVRQGKDREAQLANINNLITRQTANLEALRRRREEALLTGEFVVETERAEADARNDSADAAGRQAVNLERATTAAQDFATALVTIGVVAENLPPDVLNSIGFQRAAVGFAAEIAPAPGPTRQQSAAQDLMRALPQARLSEEESLQLLQTRAATLFSRGELSEAQFSEASTAIDGRLGEISADKKLDAEKRSAEIREETIARETEIAEKMASVAEQIAEAGERLREDVSAIFGVGAALVGGDLLGAIGGAASIVAPGAAPFITSSLSTLSTIGQAESNADIIASIEAQTTDLLTGLERLPDLLDQLSDSDRIDELADAFAEALVRALPKVLQEIGQFVNPVANLGRVGSALSGTVGAGRVQNLFRSVTDISNGGLLSRLTNGRFFHGGGQGTDGLAMVRAGEEVVPRGGVASQISGGARTVGTPGGGMTVHVHVAGDVISESGLVDRLADGLQRRFNALTGTATAPSILGGT